MPVSVPLYMRTSSDASPEEHALPIQIQFEQGRGFHLTLPSSEAKSDQLPTMFINVLRKKKLLRFSTLALSKKNNRIDEALNEVLLMSEDSVEALTGAVQSVVGALYKAAEALGMLDMVYFSSSLATASTAR